MFQTKVVKIKTNILCTIFFSENVATYKIMWKHTIQPDRPQMTIWCRKDSYFIQNMERIHSLIIFNTYCSSTATIMQTRLNVPLNIHSQSCYLLQERNSVPSHNTLTWQPKLLKLYNLTCSFIILSSRLIIHIIKESISYLLNRR